MWALILAPENDSIVITGLSLAERARRVCVRAGLASSAIKIARTADELSRLGQSWRQQPCAVVFLDARKQIVANELIAPLLASEAPVLHAVNQQGLWLRAMKLDASSGELAFSGWDETFSPPPNSQAVAVSPRAAHPAFTKEERKAATAWQYELVNKPLDSWLCVNFYRPVSRPLTKLFLRSPFTPNHITILSTIFSLWGCYIAASPDYWSHVIGFAVLVFGGILDTNDGEVARLRLEGSKLGGWLDAIGDELARYGVILSVGLHLAPHYPDFPVLPVMWSALLINLPNTVIIFWYCYFVANDPNNQVFAEAVGMQPMRKEGKRSIGQKISDFLGEVIRRDFIDLSLLVFALFSFTEFALFGMTLGAWVGTTIVVVAYIKLLKKRAVERKLKPSL